MDEAIPIWLEYADGDLSTAQFLYDKQWPRQLEIICYHCQQAGEKAVKADRTEYRSGRGDSSDLRQYGGHDGGDAHGDQSRR